MFIGPYQIIIKRIARNKNKHVTAVHGLEQFGRYCFVFRAIHLSTNRATLLDQRPLVRLNSALTSVTTGIDLKKAAKQFAQKFATGASVTKNAQGFDEVVVQGDVSDEIQELLEGQVGVLKGVDADKIVRVEEKTKKKGGAAAAGGED
jgi:translation initiation factor 1 (eIF-1/SUI1)